MREIRSPGSVRGAARKGRPYRDQDQSRRPRTLVATASRVAGAETHSRDEEAVPREGAASLLFGRRLTRPLATTSSPRLRSAAQDMLAALRSAG